MLIPISISGVNKPLQLRLMRLCHGEGSSEVVVGGRGWLEWRMDDSVPFLLRELRGILNMCSSTRSNVSGLK